MTSSSRALALLSCVLPLALAAPARADPGAPAKASASELVDALNGVFGKQPDARAVHAKGIVLEGSFTPSAQARSISKAIHLQDKPVAATVRFSDFAGIPNIPDNDPLANPRGLAIKFHLPDGSDSDIVAHSFNGFPSATADDFRDLLNALAASGPKAPKPTALDAYLGAHPVAKTFLTTQKPAPVSFATVPFYGVNTFRFINAKGDVTFGRYQFIPVAGARYLAPEQVARKAPDYLQDEIVERVKQGPVKFRFLVQVAEKGDKIDDPSIAWPDSRKTVELGILSIDRPSPDTVAASKALLFIPGAVPAGIEPEDPMIALRSGSYPVSFARRHQ